MHVYRGLQISCLWLRLRVGLLRNDEKGGRVREHGHTKGKRGHAGGHGRRSSRASRTLLASRQRRMGSFLALQSFQEWRPPNKLGPQQREAATSEGTDAGYL